MKRIFAFIVCSFLFFTVSGQDSKLLLGADVAATRSNLWGIDHDFDPVYGFSAGMNLEYVLSPALSLKTGLCYERKGYGTDLIGGNLKYLMFKNDYLLTPVLVSLSTKGTSKFYVSGGVFFGLLLKSSYEIEFYVDPDEGMSDVRANERKYDLGLSFGCGVMLPVGSRILLDLGLRDNLGFDPEHEWQSGYNTPGLVVSLKYRL